MKDENDNATRDHVKELPRGIRNNNPGNIRANPMFQWIGQVAVDHDGFVIFSTPVEGIRAMVIILRNYHLLHGCNTVADYITRWAPPSENNTEAYIDYVAHDMSIGPHVPFDLQDDLDLLISAIIAHENGELPYSNIIIQKGINLATRQ